MTTSPIQARLDQLEWTSKHDARFMGLDFFFEGAFGEAPPPGKVFVFKPKGFFEVYAEVLGDSPTRNVFELGIWLGGSAMILTALFDVEKFVCIDLSGRVSQLEDARAKYPLGDRIRPYYNTSQDDAAKLTEIFDREFEEPPDVIIDDASHLYGPSRASFEILYPRLKPGGWYIIEDWAWGHVQLPIWPEEDSLAGLIFELQLAMASSQIIERIVVHPYMVFLKKPLNAPVSRDRLNLRELYTLHHRSAPLVK